MSTARERDARRDGGPRGAALAGSSASGTGTPAADTGRGGESLIGGGRRLQRHDTPDVPLPQVAAGEHDATVLEGGEGEQGIAILLTPTGRPAGNCARNYVFDRQVPLPCGCGLSLSSTSSRWTSMNSSAIDGSTSTTATPKTISTLVSVELGAAASSIVSSCGSR